MSRKVETAIWHVGTTVKASSPGKKIFIPILCAVSYIKWALACSASGSVLRKGSGDSDLGSLWGSPL